MTIWRKVGTLFRASAHEPMEKLVDANALRIMAQELRDTEQSMVNAKRELAGLMAEARQLTRSNQQLETTIAQREAQARQAIDKGEDALALELAERIAEDENLLAEQKQHADHLAGQEKTLRKHLQQAGRTLQHYKRELSLARANQNAERVLEQLGSRTMGLHAQMGDLTESVNRIKERQTRFTDIHESLRELEQDESHGHLERKLQEAGIDIGKHDGAAVLARLRGDRSQMGNESVEGV